MSFLFKYQTNIVSAGVYSVLLSIGTQLVHLFWRCRCNICHVNKTIWTELISCRAEDLSVGFLTRESENMRVCVCVCVCVCVRGRNSESWFTKHRLYQSCRCWWGCADCVWASAVQGWYCTLEITQITALTSSLIHTVEEEDSLSLGQRTAASRQEGGLRNGKWRRNGKM